MTHLIICVALVGPNEGEKMERQSLQSSNAIAIIYAIVDKNTLAVKYVGTIKPFLEEIMRNEQKHPNSGTLVLVERVVKFEVKE